MMRFTKDEETFKRFCVEIWVLFGLKTIIISPISDHNGYVHPTFVLSIV